MGEAKRRRQLGLMPSRPVIAASESLTFDQALDLTEREGVCCWTWVPRRDHGIIVGADTFITYRDDEEEDSEREAFVSVEGDYWETPEVGEQDDTPMRDVKNELEGAVWYRSPVTDRFDLPDFSFLKLRALGCIDPAVLRRAREFDAEG